MKFVANDFLPMHKHFAYVILDNHHIFPCVLCPALSAFILSSTSPLINQMMTLDLSTLVIH